MDGFSEYHYGRKQRACKIPSKSCRLIFKRDISEQALFVLYGTGANGKSTFLNTVSDLLGDYARNTPSETFMAKRIEAIGNDIARLQGARLVTAIEINEGQRLSEALIKSFTGGDRITARFLYGEYFDFQPQFTPFLVVNHRPVIRDTSHSIGGALS